MKMTMNDVYAVGIAEAVDAVRDWKLTARLTLIAGIVSTFTDDERALMQSAGVLPPADATSRFTAGVARLDVAGVWR